MHVIKDCVLLKMADDIKDQINDKIVKPPRTNPIVRNNLPRFLSDGATRLDQFGNAINQGTAPKPYTATIFENKNNSKVHIKSDTLAVVNQAREKIKTSKTKLHTSNKSPTPQSKPKSRGLER